MCAFARTHVFCRHSPSHMRVTGAWGGPMMVAIFVGRHPCHPPQTPPARGESSSSGWSAVTGALWTHTLTHVEETTHTPTHPQELKQATLRKQMDSGFPGDANSRSVVWLRLRNITSVTEVHIRYWETCWAAKQISKINFVSTAHYNSGRLMSTEAVQVEADVSPVRFMHTEQVNTHSPAAEPHGKFSEFN